MPNTEEVTSSFIMPDNHRVFERCSAGVLFSIYDLLRYDSLIKVSGFSAQNPGHRYQLQTRRSSDTRGVGGGAQKIRFLFFSRTSGVSYRNAMN